MNYDVFISYSRRDYVDENRVEIPGNIVSQIKELLTANGISYWFDEDGISHGDEFAHIIARNIKAASLFLFISTESSNASEWTSREIAVANAYKKKIIPFRYDNSVYNDSVILFVANLDFIDYPSNPSNALTRLVSSIKEYLKELEKQREQEARRKEEEKRRREDDERSRLQREASIKERAERLASLRQRISDVRNRIYEIDTEILTVEKSLDDLREQRRTFNADLEELIAQEQQLCGRGSAPKPATSEAKPSEPAASKKDTPIKMQSFVTRWRQSVKDAPIKKQSFVARWWQSVKDAAAERSLVANIAVFAIFAASVCYFILSLYPLYIGESHYIFYGFFYCSLAGVMAATKMLVNLRIASLATLFNLLSCFVIGFVPYGDIYGNFYKINQYADDFVYPLIIIVVFVLPPLLFISLFTSKNGMRFYSVLRKVERPLYKNISIAFYILLMVISMFYVFDSIGII